MRIFPLLLAAASLTLAACSSQQLYATGQDMQRQECDKLNAMQDRQRCIAQANRPYDDYQRQADKAKGTQ